MEKDRRVERAYAIVFSPFRGEEQVLFVTLDKEVAKSYVEKFERVRSSAFYYYSSIEFANGWIKLATRRKNASLNTSCRYEEIEIR